MPTNSMTPTKKIKELLSYSKNINKAKNGAYIGGLVAYEEKLTDLVFELDSDFATKTQDLYFNTKKWYCTWNENAGIQTGLFWINVKKKLIRMVEERYTFLIEIEYEKQLITEIKDQIDTDKFCLNFENDHLQTKDIIEINNYLVQNKINSKKESSNNYFTTWLKAYMYL